MPQEPEEKQQHQQEKLPLDFLLNQTEFDIGTPLAPPHNPEDFKNSSSYIFSENEEDKRKYLEALRPDEADILLKNGSMPQEDYNHWAGRYLIDSLDVLFIEKEQLKELHTKGVLSTQKVLEISESKNLYTRTQQAADRVLHCLSNKIALDAEESVEALVTQGSTPSLEDWNTEVPFYTDPTYLVTDILSGGTLGLMRAGLKGAFTSQGLKTIGKTVAQEVGYGTAATAIEAGVSEFTPAGPYLSTLAGMLGPQLAFTLTNASRKGLGTFIKNLKTTDPEALKALRDAFTEAHSKDIDNEWTDLSDFIFTHTADDTSGLEGIALKNFNQQGLEGMSFKNFNQQEVEDVISMSSEFLHTHPSFKLRVPKEKFEGVQEIIQELGKVGNEPGLETKSYHKIVERFGELSRDGDVEGVRTLVNLLAKHSKPAQKSSKKKVVMSDKEVDRKSELKIIKDIGSELGQSKGAIAATVADAEYLGHSLEDIAVRLKAFHKNYAGLVKIIQKQASTAQSFEEMDLVFKNVQMLGEMTDIFFHTRSAMGKGLRALRGSIVPAKYKDAQFSPEDLKRFEREDAGETAAILRAFSAQDMKGATLIARNGTKHPRLKALLEVTQANYLWGLTTHAANVAGTFGNMAKRTLDNTIGLAGTAIAHKNPQELHTATMYYAGIYHGFVDSVRMPVTKFARERAKLIEKEVLDRATRQGRYNPRYPDKIHPQVKKEVKDAKFAVGYGPMWQGLMKGEAAAGSKIDGVSNSVARQLMRFTVLKHEIPIGTLFTLPFNALSAADNIFQNIGYHAHLNSRLYGAALNFTGNDPKKAMELVQEASFDISSASAGMAIKANTMKEIAVKNGVPETDFDRFLKELNLSSVNQGNRVTSSQPFGPAGQSIMTGINNNPILLSARIASAPYMHVVANLVKYPFEHNIVTGPFTKNFKRLWGAEGEEGIKSFQKRWAAGGMNKGQALSELVTGTAIIGIGAYGYEQGWWTAHPTTRENEETWRAAGIQPYSVFSPESNTYLSYNRADPALALVGIGASFAAAHEQIVSSYMDSVDFDNMSEETAEKIAADRFWTGLSLATGQALRLIEAQTVDKTFLRSLSNTINFITNPDRDTSESLVRQLNSRIPLKQGLDFYTSRRSGKDAVKIAELPDIPNIVLDPFTKVTKRYHSIYGTPLKQETPALYFMNKTKLTDDPALLEMVRVGAGVRRPSNKVKYSGVEGENPYKMSSEEYGRYNELIAATGIQKHLNTFFSSPSYSKVNDDAFKKKGFLEIVSKCRSAALDKWKTENKDFQAKHKELLKIQQKRLQGSIPSKSNPAAVQPLKKAKTSRGDKLLEYLDNR